MDYTGYQTQIMGADAGLVPSMSAVQFNALVSGMIDYAEGRVYRELNLLSTVGADGSGQLTPGSRNFTFPSHFVVVDNIAISVNGENINLTPTTVHVLNALWGSVNSAAAVPQLFAMLTDQSILVGPFPDQAYSVIILGTQRPTPLSATNTTTWLTLYVPDLFVAASMVYASGWMRNFGSQADDPKMAQSWESQYQSLFASANVEELRKKFQGPGWTSQQPSPIATPPRQ